MRHANHDNPEAVLAGKRDESGLIPAAELPLAACPAASTDKRTRPFLVRASEEVNCGGWMTAGAALTAADTCHCPYIFPFGGAIGLRNGRLAFAPRTMVVVD